MTDLENVYKTIEDFSDTFIEDGKEWVKEISSAKNYVVTPDLNHWTFGKSAGLDGNYYNGSGGAAKLWLYSLGFVDVLKLSDENFKSKITLAFETWTKKVECFDIFEKFRRDQKTNSRFELLVHNSIIPSSLLQNESYINEIQSLFEEGFKSQIITEVSKRNRKVTDLAKAKYGTRCSVCDFDFGEVYGSHGHGFIEIHHLDPINLGKRKSTVEDLRPVCPNCHRMLHKGNTVLGIEELKNIVRNNKRLDK